MRKPFHIMFHQFKQDIQSIQTPTLFNNPFYYTAHPLCIVAAQEVQNYIETLHVAEGKMYGVLIVQTSNGKLGYLAAFSGLLNGVNHHTYFVPPIYDLLSPDGYFKVEETQITNINKKIKEIEQSTELNEALLQLEKANEEFLFFKKEAKVKLKEAKIERDKKRKQSLTEHEEADIVRESQFMKAQFKREETLKKENVELKQLTVDELKQRIESLKAERKRRSASLQEWLFHQYVLRNNRGEAKTMLQVFDEVANKVPPGGSGECAGPKLLQYAYINGLKPIAMAEFWWGPSPQNEIRKQGVFYPSCNEKCKPILSFMLQGLNVEENLLEIKNKEQEVEIVFEDDYLLVINKPPGVLSVPGKQSSFSIYEWAKKRYPNATGPIIVHRLDMDTSGILLLAKSKEIHKSLQEQFALRNVSKQYVALLEGSVVENQGTISLALCCDPTDRPRQMVSDEYGKTSITQYEVIERSNQFTRVLFTPITGRTHQLRVHAAHHKGLNAPIMGDALYGKKADRLYLHAERISFVHPASKEVITMEVKANF